MSERERLRRLRVENRLEELAHKYGPLERRSLPEPDINPSWGPVGALLKRTDPALYEHVMRQHLDLLATERSRRGATIDAQAPGRPENQPAAQKPPIEPPWTWDEYGESPVLDCPRCGERSAKANIRIDLWNCTACSAHGKASALVPQGPPARGKSDW